MPAIPGEDVAVSELFDLSDTPTFFLVPLSLIGVVFVVLPAVTIGRLLRDRNRRRSWTTTRARLLATRTDTHHHTGDDAHGHHRTRTMGRWEYRDGNGTTQTGEGDLDGVWLTDDGGQQELDVLVDPTDQRRSQARTAPPGPAAVLVAAVMGVFGVIGLLVLFSVAAVLLG